MSIRHTLIAAALAGVLGGLIVPALAAVPGGWRTMPDQSTDGMGRGTMSGGMMPGAMMSGCTEMMQSMSGGGGRPNSQWRAHPRGGPAMPK